MRTHVNESVVKRPSRAIATLENDLKELIANGMLTLNSKLTNLDDDKLLPRLIELWGFFWDQILTYVEAVFLPFQTEPILFSLGKVGKARAQETGARIDVRELTLRAFRNEIIFPIYPRLATRLGIIDLEEINRPRLQQMLLVLLSTANRSAVQQEPAEAAVSHLLRLVRTPLPAMNGGVSASQSPSAAPPSALHAHTSLRRAHPPSFLSAGIARDRRGRIQQPGSLDPSIFTDGEEDDSFDVEGDGSTPRGQYAFDTRDPRERERGMKILASLKSPEADQVNRVAPQYGLGLGLTVHGHRPSLDSQDDYGEEYIRR